MKYIFKGLILSVLFAAPTQEELINEIEQSLMAPCCWSGTVYDHGNSEMENGIRLLVEEGKTKKEIMDHYVGIYGERILAVPVAQGFNFLAWIAPVIIAAIAFTVLGLYFKTSKKSPIVEPKHVADVNIPFNDQIEKELKELD